MNVAIETTLVRARSRVTAGLLALAGVLGSGSVTAQEVTYAEVDRAVVRVLALDTPDVVEVAHHGQKYKFGVPGAGHGSGTVLTKEGLVLTAEHVVSGARAVAVLVPGAETAVTARVLFADKQRDYALLQIAGEQPHVATLCEDGKAFSVREEVFALGYPLDSARNEPQSSRGVVSGKMADGDLQLDMSVNPGNSGGPVIAKGDQVCGIVIERSDPDQGAIGIVKAVPMAAMRDKIEQWRDADPSREPERDADQGIATLLTMLANTGSGWFEASLESSGSQDDQNDEVEALARQYPKSADVQLLTAVYLWNRHTICKATGRQLRGLSERNSARRESGQSGSQLAQVITIRPIPAR